MITDLGAIPPGTSIETDLCVIGAGAAGISIARALIPTGLRVIVLESGGLRREADVQDLYAGPSVGERYYRNLDECRSRYFGGSTNCWGAIFTPLNEIDFEKREWVPWSGWPVRYDEMEPWLRKAHEACGAGPYLYGEAAWKAAGIPEGDFDPTVFDRFVWHFDSRSAALSFGKRYRREIRAARNVDVILHANVAELLTDESGRVVERARVTTARGEDRFIRARAFILACGGIENPRLLLASRSTHRHGLGNDRDLVGRFFHEHIQLPVAYLVSRLPRAARYSYLSRLGGTFCLPGLVLTRAAQRQNRILNGSLSIDPVYDDEGAWMAFQKMRASLREGRVSRELFRHLWTVCSDGSRFAPEAWRRIVNGDRPRGEPGRFMIYARCEQAPNPESRVKLTSETDALGMPRVCLDWHTTELDRGAVRFLLQMARREFARLDLGEVVENPWPAGSAWPEPLAEGPHHMGTTRMSDDPASGVVDAHCKVHGLTGLYIAGSSIFPTGGHANPTMSLIAFALRLADHVRQQLRQERSSVTLQNFATRDVEQTELRRSAASARFTALPQPDRSPLQKPIGPDVSSMLSAGQN